MAFSEALYHTQGTLLWTSPFGQAELVLPTYFPDEVTEA